MAAIYLIPSGPKNLAILFPAIDWNKVDDYYLEILDENEVLIATTPLFLLGCCCDTEGIRIHFLNYLGQYDAINFSKPTISHDTEFSSFRKSLSFPLSKTDTGEERFNIFSNDTYIAVNNCYGEKDMDWIRELLDTPKAFLEWKGIESQNDDYLPIVITSKKFEKQKNQNEYSYIVTIEFHLSNDYQTIRN